MKKKNKGSTILLVLAIGMVIVLLGATLTSAIAYTTKMNIASKVDNDFLVSAESGLEYGIASYSISNGVSPVNTGDAGITTLNASSNVGKVRIKTTGNSNEALIESTAVDNSGIEKIKVSIKLKKVLPINGDIFKYGIATGTNGISVSGEGTNKFSSSSTNSAGPQSDTMTGVFEDALDDHKTNYAYEDLQFITKFEHKDKVTVSRISDLSDAAIVDNSNLGDVSQSTIDGISSIPGVAHFITNPTDSRKYKVYIVNADELEIVMDGSDVWNYTILICSGKVRIRGKDTGGGNFSGGTITTNNSTLYAQEVVLEKKGTMDLYGSPIISGMHGVNQYELDYNAPTKLNTLQQQIQKVIANFGLVPGGGSPAEQWKEVQGSYTKVVL